MEEKFNKMILRSSKAMSEKTDYLIVSYLDGLMGTTVKGNVNNIAHAFFGTMLKPGDPIGEVLFKILKLNVINILKNETEYANELLTAINNALEDDLDEKIHSVQPN